MENDKLKWCIEKFSRSKNQILFLFNLVDNNFDKYIDLELKIKLSNISYCPGDKEEIFKIMSL